MTDNFISIKEVEPQIFDLCDIQINGSDSICTECRYAKYNDGTTEWICPQCVISFEAVSGWRLSPLHSDEATELWLKSLEKRSDRPDIKEEDIFGTVTYNRKV